MNIAWDAGKYASDFSFVPKYGEGVADLLDLPAGSRVLDLGCGNGVLTAALRERGYDAFGLDASPELLDAARRDHPDIRFIHGDAACFALPEPVDGVFSNAVFHWIGGERQPVMLRCIRDALRPGGRLVFEMGGRGNNRLIHASLRRSFEKRGVSYEIPFYFPTVGEYAALLEEAGFRVVFAALFERPTPLAGEDGMAEWIRMFVKTPFARVPEGEREAVISEAAEALRSELYRDSVWTADYVRLRMKAVRL